MSYQGESNDGSNRVRVRHTWSSSQSSSRVNGRRLQSTIISSLAKPSLYQLTNLQEKSTPFLKSSVKRFSWRPGFWSGTMRRLFGTASRIRVRIFYFAIISYRLTSKGSEVRVPA